TQLLSAPGGAYDQASSRGRGLGVFNNALDTRQRGAGDYAAGRKRRRAKPARAADVQTGGRGIYAVRRTSIERALEREATAQSSRLFGATLRPIAPSSAIIDDF